MNKTCACGAAYDSDGWHALPFVGLQDDGVGVLELRQCVAPRDGRRCNSTMAVVVADSPDAPALRDTWPAPPPCRP